MCGRVESGSRSSNISKSELDNVRRLQLILRSELPLVKLVKVCKAALQGWGVVLAGYLDISATAYKSNL